VIWGGSAPNPASRRNALNQVKRRGGGCKGTLSGTLIPLRAAAKTAWRQTRRGVPL
jgi:hypothetical protein